MKKFFTEKQFNIFGQILIVLTLAMAIADLNLYAVGEPTAIQRFLASIIIALGFLPTLLYLKDDEPGIPFLPLFGIIYSIYYALPIFTLNKYVITTICPSEGALIYALLVSVIGFAALIFAYYGVPGKSAGKFIPKISIRWDLQKARFWAMIFCSVGVIFNTLLVTFSIPARFVQIILFLSELLIIGIGMLFILQLQGRLDRIRIILLWVIFVPSIFILRLATGSISQVFLIIVFLSFTYWCFSRKMPWKQGIAMILLLIFLSSAKSEFRNLSWWGTSGDKNPVKKGMLFVKLVFTNREAFKKGCEIAAMRTSHNLMSFAHVIDLTPKSVPYWMGKSYGGLLWAPLPRVIAPWKPSITLGQDFGHRYGFLLPYDKHTSWNLPQLVEMYANFGIIGAVVGMFILGAIYRLLYEMFCHPKAGEGMLLIGIFIFTRLTNIESDFSNVFGNIVHYIILLAAINWLMRERDPERCQKK